MSSIMTNASAMTALKTLNATNKNLETTQARISTGCGGRRLRQRRLLVDRDHDAFRQQGARTVQDALGLGAAKVDTAYTGMTAAIEVVDEIKSKLVAAREPGMDRTKIQAEITSLQGQLTSNASAASFSGENWLSVDSSTAGYNASKSIVASFTRSAAGSVSVGTITVDTSSTKLFDSATDAAAAGTGILDETLRRRDRRRSATSRSATSRSPRTSRRSPTRGRPDHAR